MCLLDNSIIVSTQYSSLMYCTCRDTDKIKSRLWIEEPCNVSGWNSWTFCLATIIDTALHSTSDVHGYGMKKSITFFHLSTKDFQNLVFVLLPCILLKAAEILHQLGMRYVHVTNEEGLRQTQDELYDKEEKVTKDSKYHFKPFSLF